VTAAAAEGPAVAFRMLRGDDRQLVADVFSGLGERSRRLRFLSPKTALSAAELDRLVDVDGDRQAAVVAVDAVDGRGLGIARFVRSADDPGVADVAIAVVDDWQRRGLGTQLLGVLAATAASAGVGRFVALVSPENAGVRRLLARLHAVVASARIEQGAVEYEVEVASLARPGPLSGAVG
jgi:GNAT superfamily N-acetyltransferase